jgi:hypothetical protein
MLMSGGEAAVIDAAATGMLTRSDDADGVDDVDLSYVMDACSTIELA